MLDHPRSGTPDGYEGSRANNVGKFINTHIKEYAPGKTSHCYRHSVEHYLRDQDVPKEDAEVLVGHKSKSMSYGRYGNRMTMQKKLRQISKLNFPNIKLKRVS